MVCAYITTAFSFLFYCRGFFLMIVGGDNIPRKKDEFGGFLETHVMYVSRSCKNS